MQIFQNSPIYILQYPKGRESSHSEGILYKINNTNIEHSCSVDFGSSGSPILSLSTFKVIGVHKRLTNNNFNEGTLIYFIINDFNNICPNNSNQNKNHLENRNNQINNNYYNLNNNNIYNKQDLDKRFIGNKVNIYNVNNNVQFVNKTGLPVVNYQFNNNIEYNNKLNYNYVPQNYNNYNIPLNNINNGYYNNNEI